MTRLLGVPALIGGVIAVIAIGAEEAGFWQTRHSLIFCALAVLGFGVGSHFFLWKRKIFKLSYDG